MHKKRFLTFFILAIISALLVAACASAAQPGEGEPHEEGEEEHAHVDPPAEYADLTNPFAEDHEAAEAGASIFEVNCSSCHGPEGLSIFEVNCSSCHGPEGLGDGPAAEGLDPKPASLADPHMMEDLSDGYLFWRVSEGGAFEPFNSAMPPWKGVLSETERWQVVTFLRELSEEEH